MEGCLGSQQNWEQSMRGQSKKTCFCGLEYVKHSLQCIFFLHKFKLNFSPHICPWRNEYLRSLEKNQISNFDKNFRLEKATSCFLVFSMVYLVSGSSFGENPLLALTEAKDVDTGFKLVSFHLVFY